MKNILGKLNKIQAELKAPKGQFNSFGKYKYRSCEDILEAVKPLLASHGCAIVISDTMSLHGDRYYVEATVTIYDCESGESISNTAYARESADKKGMDESQITGTASSYARKYALNGMLAIDDTKDADATNTHGKKQGEEPSEDTQADMPKESKVDTGLPVGKSHIDFMLRMIAETESDTEQFLKFMGVESLDQMTIGEFTLKAKPTLESKKAKMKGKQ